MKSADVMFREFYQALLGSQTERVYDKEMNRDPNREILDLTGITTDELITHGKTAIVNEYYQSVDESRRGHLKNMGDTYGGILFEESTQVIESLGFELAYHEKFPDSDDQGTLEIFYHNDGMLLTHESYKDKTSLISLDFNYLIQEGLKLEFFQIRMNRYSSEVDENVHICHLDVTEGLKYKIGRVKKCGKLVKPWLDENLFLLNSAESAEIGKFSWPLINDLITKINCYKLEKFPDHIRKDLGL